MDKIIQQYIRHVYPLSRQKQKKEKNFNKVITLNPLDYNQSPVIIKTLAVKLTIYLIIKEDVIKTFNITIENDDKIDKYIKRVLIL